MSGAQYSPRQMASWSGGVWNGDPPFAKAGISHDTRTLRPGEIYLALRGASFDGHDFIPQAVARGAAGLIVERLIAETADCPQLVVPDTMEALRALAAGARSLWRGTVVGITGSVGKTTVKEMIAAMLSQQGVTAKTPGNRNNEIGLPLSMLQVDGAADFFVFELGMNRPGEIGRLAALLRPDWAVLTDIGKAHIEQFGTVEGIAREKASLLDHARYAVLDETCEWFELFVSRCRGRIVTCGQGSFPYRLAQAGEYMVRNARRAAALARELGLNDEQIQTGLDSFSPGPMRWQISSWRDATLINDAYNANPLSMRAALETFASLPCEGKRIAVLGSMLELGALSEHEHRDLGRFIDSLPIDRVITVGRDGALIECRRGTACSMERAAGELAQAVQPGDMVLFKASRGEQLEQIIDRLIADGAGADAEPQVGAVARGCPAPAAGGCG